MADSMDLIMVFLTGTPRQGVPLAVAHSPGAIGNVGGLLERISMVAHRASGNTIFFTWVLYT